ncbi:MAG TPA: acetoacetate decarboxylase [Stellaceae bacterium]|nr:acetoacetate decarboxylase [Stellaceae bacterium]
MSDSFLENAFAMPIFSPSYPRGPYRFVHREYMVITYESDPQLVRAAVPEPLRPVGNLVAYEWMKMPDSSGFGDYTETGQVIPCTLDGEPVNFPVQMYLDDEPPITAGREIWGFPKKYAHPKLELARDTLTGTLHYAGERVAMGTMAYKHEDHSHDHGETLASLTKTQVTLKLIPDVDGTPKIAQLVAFAMTDVTVHGSWAGPGRLHLVPHVNCRVADLPVGRIVGAKHYIADMTLPYGRVVHDYLA